MIYYYSIRLCYDKWTADNILFTAAKYLYEEEQIISAAILEGLLYETERRYVRHVECISRKEYLRLHKQG